MQFLEVLWNYLGYVALIILLLVFLVCSIKDSIKNKHKDNELDY